MTRRILVPLLVVGLLILSATAAMAASVNPPVTATVSVGTPAAPAAPSTPAPPVTPAAPTTPTVTVTTPVTGSVTANVGSTAKAAVKGATTTAKATVGSATGTVKATVGATAHQATNATHNTTANVNSSGATASTHTAASSLTHAAATAPATTGTVSAPGAAGSVVNSAAAHARSAVTGTVNGNAAATRSGVNANADATVRVCLNTGVADQPVVQFNTTPGVLASSAGALKAVVGNVCPWAKASTTQTLNNVTNPTTLASNGQTVICYHTGLIDDPWARAVVSQQVEQVLVNQGADVVPATATGCPSSTSGNGSGPGGGTTTDPGTLSDGLVVVCYYTGLINDPYVHAVVTQSALAQHATQEADLIPAPASGCPSTPPAGDTTGGGSTGGGGTGTGPVSGSVTICYFTGLINDPYVKLTVAQDVLDQSFNEAANIIPAPATGCPATAPAGAANGGSTSPAAAGGVLGQHSSGGNNGGPGSGTGASNGPGAGPAQTVAAAKTGSPHSGVLGQIAHGTLPYTGFPIWAVVLIAVALLLIGFGLRGRNRTGRTTSGPAL